MGSLREDLRVLEFRTRGLEEQVKRLREINKNMDAILSNLIRIGKCCMTSEEYILHVTKVLNTAKESGVISYGD